MFTRSAAPQDRTVYCGHLQSNCVHEENRAVGDQDAKNVLISMRSRHLLSWISSKLDKKKVTKEEGDKI